MQIMQQIEADSDCRIAEHESDNNRVAVSLHDGFESLSFRRTFPCGFTGFSSCCVRVAACFRSASALVSGGGAGYGGYGGGGGSSGSNGSVSISWNQARRTRVRLAVRNALLSNPLIPEVQNRVAQ